MLCCFCVLRRDCKSNTVRAYILVGYLPHYRCHIATLLSQLMENLKNLRLIKIWSG
ncbi:hypothetical protein Plhal304r1_c073g0161311 [Plasmopara halstedii]